MAPLVSGCSTCAGSCRMSPPFQLEAFAFLLPHYIGPMKIKAATARTSFATRSSLLPAHEETAACPLLPYPLRHSPWPHIMMCWQDARTCLVEGWFQA